jgi:transcription initiation factor IIE alpha subunit
MTYFLSDTALLRAAVYEFILRSGAAGVTDEEISDYMDIPIRSIRAHRYALVRNRLVMAMHPRRRVSSGRNAMVWLSTGVVRKLLNYRHNWA